VREDIVFNPIVNLNTAPGQSVLRLVRLLTEALGNTHSFAGSIWPAGPSRSVALLDAVGFGNNYSERLARLAGPRCRGRCGVPRSIFVAMPRN
jgi:hypothetical protein